MRFEKPVPYKQELGPQKWFSFESDESEVDRIARLAVALTDMDFLKLASRLIRDPRINTAALAASLSKGKYPYHAADIASEEIQAKLAAKPLVHPVSSPLKSKRNNIISPCTAAERSLIHI